MNDILKLIFLFGLVMLNFTARAEVKFNVSNNTMNCFYAASFLNNDESKFKKGNMEESIIRLNGDTGVFIDHFKNRHELKLYKSEDFKTTKRFIYSSQHKGHGVAVVFRDESEKMAPQILFNVMTQDGDKVTYVFNCISK